MVISHQDVPGEKQLQATFLMAERICGFHQVEQENSRVLQEKKKPLL